MTYYAQHARSIKSRFFFLKHRNTFFEPVSPLRTSKLSPCPGESHLRASELSPCHGESPPVKCTLVGQHFDIISTSKYLLSEGMGRISTIDRVKELPRRPAAVSGLLCTNGLNQKSTYAFISIFIYICSKLISNLWKYEDVP